MLTIIWGVGGFPVVDLMTSQRSFDSQYFMSNVMMPLIASLFLQRRIPHARRLHLHLENCRVYFSKIIEQFITQNQILRVPHRPYSPDIAPPNFHLFCHVQNSLVGWTFDGLEHFLEAITEFLDEIHPSEWEAVSSH
jgi:histone-lysine N-methyltransferase SETMAR